MSTNAQTRSRKRLRNARLVRRAGSHLRRLRKRLTAYRRRLRRASTLALAAACLSAPGIASAQLGQAAMAPSGGVLNRAVTGLSNLNQYGPGWLYFGVNPADRGLGYNGSYITLGGFIPYGEDDLGGFWSADLRGHLSEYGGFFSNLGMVRKQFVGGSLLGVGVYWDYDGDQDQYPVAGMQGTERFGQFGHTYNQVGVSAELLTDYGNIRSNGYMPVGTTAYTVGNPQVPFYRNMVMCQYGLDAALSGADLEVGAYVPGLTDWAGMVSVGGYALGNARYDWTAGPRDGDDVVPWFGGVYTRLDMTFLENWDFSIQANNDSYFDWTGFLRLTYRMGGSRRRSVPDQMEQPMWRNEHIVRAHQTPVVVQNPDDGDAFWSIIHVDNTAAAGGDGTYERPFTTLAEADAAATDAWDVVYVHEGSSTSGNPYGGTFSFNAPNQSLVGSGGPFVIAAQADCGINGLYRIQAQSDENPVLTAPGAPSVVIADGSGGATVANLDIIGSGTGILASGDLTGAAKRAGTTANPLGLTATGATAVRNVLIEGNGTSAPQRGVNLVAATGGIEFSDTAIVNMTNTGFSVAGGDADVEYYGTIFSDFDENGGVASPIIAIADTTGGTINLAFNGPPAGATVANAVTDIAGGGIIIEENAAATEISIGNVTLIDSVGTAISLREDRSDTTIVQQGGDGILKRTNGAAIEVDGGAPTFLYDGNIVNAFPTAGATSSYMLVVANVSADSLNDSITIQSADPFRDSANGILISNTTTEVNVLGESLLSGATPQGILINDSASGTITINNATITGATQQGVLIQDTSATVNLSSVAITLEGASAAGIAATNPSPAGALNIGGLSSISTVNSTATPALSIEGISALSADILNIASGVPSGGNDAIVIATSNGTLRVSSSFTVDGGTTKGTEAADVTAPGTVTVILPP